MTRISLRRPSAPLLLSLLALFVALGGPAVAGDAVTSAVKKITGKQIAKNAIKSKHLKNGGVKAKDIAPGVVPDAYAKGESDAKYLAAGGKAADADKLDGKDSTAFLGANAKAADADLLDGRDAGNFMQGQAFHGSRSMTEGAPAVALFEIPNQLRVTAGCAVGSPPQAGFDFQYLTSWAEEFSQVTNNTGNSLFLDTSIANGTTSDWSTSGAPQQLDVTLSRRGVAFGGGGSQVTRFSGVHSTTGGDTCRFAAQAFTRDSRFVAFQPPILLP